jgi:hypothetical protein
MLALPLEPPDGIGGGDVQAAATAVKPTRSSNRIEFIVMIHLARILHRD